MKSQSLQHFLTLLRYALPYRRQVIIQFIFMGISVGFSLLKPWPMKILVDNVVGDAAFTMAGWSPDWGWQTLLLVACGAYMIFHGGESLIQVGSATVATLTSSRMIRDLRADLLRRLQALSLRFHDSHKVGDLVHRIAYNSTAVETAFQSGFMGATKSIVTLIAMFVVMLFMNVLLTMVAVAVVPFLLLTIRWYAHRTHRVSFLHQTQEGKVSSTLQEVLSSIRLVKAFNREPLEQSRFEEISHKSVETRLRSTLVQKTFGLCTAVILAAGTAFMFFMGIHQVKTEEISLGQFLVFVAYLAMLYSPLSVLSYTASSVQGALGGGTRLFEVLDSEEEITEAPDARSVETFQNSLRLENLYFGYDREKRVLKNINTTINRGERVAIVGETGSGKSTLFNLLLRFYDPWDGSIIIDGNDVRELKLSSLRSLFSFVPQDTLLLSDSIRENIAFAKPDASEEEILEAAKMAEAHDFIEECPNGYDTVVGERGIFLSVGQRQRIALARAFLKDAPIFLVDEPTSALDAETEGEIMKRLTELQGRTMILVAHRLSTIRRADRVIVLSHGEMVEEGTHDELLAKEGAYARLWHAQVSGFEIGPGGKL